MKNKSKPNFAFEADAVKRRAVSCCIRAPRGSTKTGVRAQFPLILVITVI